MFELIGPPGPDLSLWRREDRANLCNLVRLGLPARILDIDDRSVRFGENTVTAFLAHRVAKPLKHHSQVSERDIRV